MPTLRARLESGPAARRLGAASAGLPGDARTTARVVGQGAVLIFRGYAPRRSGRLRRGIRLLSTGGAFTVRADARNPATGYDYVGVTRFGHRLRIIRPRGDRAAASVVATGRARAGGRQAALRIVMPGGQVIYRRQVKGYRPAHDWAARAHRPIRRLAESNLVRLATTVERRIRG